MAREIQLHSSCHHHCAGLSHAACADACSVLQAVASAHKALSSALTGVQLQGDEEEALGARLKAAADKKLGDLLQVCAVVTGGSRALGSCEANVCCSSRITGLIVAAGSKGFRGVRIAIATQGMTYLHHAVWLHED